ncbi:hypothetical protein Pla108_35330 [Botrimarina colliarenosi]|uniref:Uncharacterized protein n=1 Tax=Botrimarina colliarenosi TaxID=2528001 RepID=A0A5C6A7T5_9BACT|nr:hypothetical protein [Botrimarina colliarenosi]TWT95385.1 hypothetical protein Pla108_35330 [Botrimarina colliarenosi]
MSLINFALVHPTSGETANAEFDGAGTPQQLLDQLVQQNWLKPPTDGTYALNCPKDPNNPDGEKRQLTDKESFADQHVPAGATLTISIRAKAAADTRVSDSHHATWEKIEVMKCSIAHPILDEVAEIVIPADMTPKEVIEQVFDLSWIKRHEGLHHFFQLAIDDTTSQNNRRTLESDTPIRDQGVPVGTTLYVIGAFLTGAAPRRTGPSLERLRTDYRSLKDIEGRGCVREVKVFADAALKVPVLTEADAGRMRRYLVTLNMPLPASATNPKQLKAQWKVVFDLEPDWPRYPHAQHYPHVTFVGPKPWHHRVSSSGRLCTQPVGSKSLVAGQHVGMIAAVLNGDEAFSLATDKGYDVAAYKYYTEVLRGPVNPGLEIPNVRRHVFDPSHLAAAPFVVRLSGPTRPVAIGEAPRLKLS